MKFIALVLPMTLILLGCGNDSEQEKIEPSSNEAAPVSPDQVIINQLKSQDHVKSWKETVMLEREQKGNASEPQIATNAQGKAVAVWTLLDAGKRSIVASYYELGTGWGEPVRLHGNADGPKVVMAPNGDVVVAVSTRDSLLSFHFEPATGWGQAQVVANNNMFNPDHELAIDVQGNAMLIWLSKSEIYTGIWSARFQPGSGWGTATNISNQDAGNARKPQIDIANNGSAIAIWAQGTMARSDIWSSTFNPSSGWGKALAVETDSESNSHYPQIEINDNGSATAVWLHNDGEETSVWANQFSGGKWNQPEAIENVTEGNAHFLRLDSDKNGNAIAIWSQTDGKGNSSIWVNHLYRGAWAEAQDIVENSVREIMPDIAFCQSGKAYAVWQHFKGGTYHIWTNKYQPGDGWGQADVLKKVTRGSARNPKISVSKLGNAITVWQQNDGNRSSIEATELY